MVPKISLINSNKKITTNIEKFSEIVINMLNNEKLKKKYENESKTFTYQSKFLKSSSLALIRGMGIERYCLPTLIEYCIVILN